jgi:hypothetical protein
MADLNHKHEQLLVVDLVDDAVITDANPIKFICSLELDAASGPGFCSSASIASRRR